MADLRRVFLVGPMGAGKTTIGKHLSRGLGLGFADTDTEVELRTGADIPWIFDVEGEQGFRDREQQVVEEMTEWDNTVLATGGGVVMREANRRALAARGFVVYLHAPLEEQLRRTRNDRNRPLLQVEDPAAALRELMAVRDPLYREIADHVIDTDGSSPKTVAQRLLQELRAYQSWLDAEGRRGNTMSVLMHTLHVDLDVRSYPIYVGRDLLGDPSLLAEHVAGNQVLIVSNTTVAPLLMARLRAALDPRLAVTEVILPDGEQYKTLETLSLIFDAALRDGHNRSSTFIALGGGVVGDTAGFAAASYQRGVPFIQIPTTLLAHVDSSVGGKTAVNHPLGKNMIGAFYQPAAVIIDLQVLHSLPAREFSAGVAEVIKYGLIRDLQFYDWLREEMPRLLAREEAVLGEAIERSCAAKADVVAADEREGGARALLNLGHTFGHAIETAQGYGVWLHGEAVAAGMVLAARLSQQRGWLQQVEVDSLCELLTHCGLPTQPPAEMSAGQFIELMRRDKKVINGNMRFVLLRAIGDAVLDDQVTEAEIEALFSSSNSPWK